MLIQTIEIDGSCLSSCFNLLAFLAVIVNREIFYSKLLPEKRSSVFTSLFAPLRQKKKHTSPSVL